MPHIDLKSKANK